MSQLPYCLHCGEKRVSTISNKYCSRSCSAKVTKNRKKSKVKVICKLCGKEFFLPRWQAKKRKFCSSSCATKNMMNNTPIGDIIVKRLRSPSVRNKALKTYKTKEYREKRSAISKVSSNKDNVRLISRKTMLKLHKKIHNDSEWKRKVSESAKRRIKEGTFGGGISGVDYKGKGLMAGKKTIHKRTGIVMRSTWEVLFADMCDRNNIKWSYECKNFVFDWTRYTPDFRLDNGLYIDVKPERRFHLQPEKRIRFNKLIKEFEGIGMKLIILDKKNFGDFFTLAGGELLQS